MCAYATLGEDSQSLVDLEMDRDGHLYLHAGLK